MAIIDANNTNYNNVIAQINTYETALDTTHATYEQYDEFQSQNVGRWWTEVLCRNYF